MTEQELLKERELLNKRIEVYKARNKEIKTRIRRLPENMYNEIELKIALIEDSTYILDYGLE